MKDPIVQAGDPLLRKRAMPVLKKDILSSRIRRLIARMKKALSVEKFGVAIAAPQIGESLRIFVVSGKAFLPPTKEGREQRAAPPDMVFINPEIIRLSKGKKEMTEGCLSVRNQYGSVLRHEKATVRALNEKGMPITYHGSNLIAHIFQHEVDHLEGVLYTDKAVKLEDDEGWVELGKKRAAQKNNEQK